MQVNHERGQRLEDRREHSTYGYEKSTIVIDSLAIGCFVGERGCSLVVTRALVASEVLGSTPHGSEYFMI